MKKILSLVMLLAGVTMFTACGDDDPTYTAPAKLTIKSADAFYEAAGGTGTIVVSSNEAITATTDANWLTVSVAGQTVTLTVSANDKLEGRSANINLKSASASAKVNITQKGIIYGIADGLTYTFSDSADSIAIPIDHTAAVQVKSLADWITASFNADNHTIEISVPNYEEGEDRYGYVAVSTGVVQDTLLIVQEGMTYQISTTAPSIPTNGEGSTVVLIKHTKELIAESLNPDWLSVSLDDTKDPAELTISATANLTGSARLGRVRIATGNIVDTLVVTQMNFAEEVYGSYLFAYIYPKDGEWYTANAELNDSALIIDDDGLLLTIPASVNMETGVVSFGPCASKVGTFAYQGMDLDLRLMWLNLAESYFSSYENTQDVATGTLAVEEEEDEEGTYNYTVMNLGGTFEGKDIDIWDIEAFYGGFNEDADVGYLAMYAYPYMIKVPADNGGELEQPAEPSEARKLYVAKKMGAIKRLARKQKGLGVLRTPWRK